MEEEKGVPRMVAYLFGEAAGRVFPMAPARLLRWAQAFDDWLRAYPKSNVYREQMRMAWKRLLERVGKPPWELTQEDIEGHIQGMVEAGYARQTMRNARIIFCDFYAWCGDHGIDPECGADFNPAEGAARPKQRIYDTRQLFSEAEIQALLDLMGRDTTALGKRDYAFFLVRLHSGIAFQRLREMRWKQIEREALATGGVQVYLRIQEEEGANGHSARRMVLPAGVWGAMEAYLAASGRVERSGGGLDPEAYVFVPIKKPYYDDPEMQRIEWDEGRCIEARSLTKSLKRYGRAAGIAEGKLTMENLRLTAVRMRLDSQAPLREIKAFLDTPLPLKIVAYRARQLPALPEETGELESEAEVPRRAMVPVSGGVMRHGFYASSLPAAAVRAVMAEGISDVKAEIRCFRELMRGLVTRSEETRDAHERARLGLAYTTAADRLQGLILLQKPGGEAEKAAAEDEEALETMVRLLEIQAGYEGRAYDREAARQGVLAGALGGGPLQNSGALQNGGAGGEQPEDGEEGEGLEALQVDEEIATARLVLRNAYHYALEAESNADYISRVELYGLSAVRLAKLLGRRGRSAGAVAAYWRRIRTEGIRRAAERLTLV